MAALETHTSTHHIVEVVAKPHIVSILLYNSPSPLPSHALQISQFTLGVAKAPDPSTTV